MYDAGTLVHVAWDDAIHIEDDVPQDVEVPYRRETVGFVVRHDRRSIVVAMTKDEDGYTKGYGIPMKYVCCVKELVSL